MDARRKRLLYRSRYRGLHENDLLLGRFADARLAGLSEAQLDRFEALLERPDNDLYDWITDRRPAPAECDHDVLRMIIKFNNVSSDFDKQD